MNNGNRLLQHPLAFSRGIYPSAFGQIDVRGCPIAPWETGICSFPENGLSQQEKKGLKSVSSLTAIIQSCPIR